jgi:hypothetical protein
MRGPHCYIQRQKNFHRAAVLQFSHIFYCSEAFLYQKVCKNWSILVLFRSDMIAMGPIGQAMGPHVVHGPPV